jgi:hypothetical protein
MRVFRSRLLTKAWHPALFELMVWQLVFIGYPGSYFVSKNSATALEKGTSTVGPGAFGTGR